MGTPQMACSKRSVERALDLRPGDKIFFYGCGFLSLLIRFGTCTWWQLFTLQWVFGKVPSHVATVFRRGRDLLLVESTTLNSQPCCVRGLCVKGVQAHPIIDRIRSYRGRVAVVRWNEYQRLDTNQSKKLTQMVLARLGESYDAIGAAVCGAALVSRWWQFDKRKTFCSELGAWFDKQLGKEILSPGRSGRISPAAYQAACVDSDLCGDLEFVKSNSRPGASLNCEV
jgi:hypothetical protein